MPILDVEKASCFIVSLSPGYAGVDNDLFYREYTNVVRMQKMTEDIIKVSNVTKILRYCRYKNY